MYKRQDIIKFVKDKYKLLIGDRTAEQIKMQIGTAIKGISEEIFEVRGRDLVTGLPHTITITADETELALRETCQTIVRETKHVLEQTPPELAADIVSRGIFLTGGYRIFLQTWHYQWFPNIRVHTLLLSLLPDVSPWNVLQSVLSNNWL